jgi:hypothetical protein
MTTEAPTTPDPIEMAMEADARSEAPGALAREVLKKQSALIGWQIASERAGFTLKVLTGVTGVVVAAVLALMAWQASRADGLVIKPFSVPPELAQHGVTGEAVAGEFLDHINVMAATAQSNQRRRSIFADPGKTVSIEIPSTGVSLDQVDQWLRARLGRQTIVTGELTQAPDGTLSLAVRAGDRPLPLQTGASTDVRALAESASEALFGQEQGIAYYQYLTHEGRWADALQHAQRATLNPDPIEAARAWVGVGVALGRLQGDEPARRAWLTSLAIDTRGSPQGAQNLSDSEFLWGHPEAGVRLARRARATFRLDPQQDPGAASDLEAGTDSTIGIWTDDAALAYSAGRRFRLSPHRGFVTAVRGSHTAEARRCSPCTRPPGRAGSSPWTRCSIST